MAIDEIRKAMESSARWLLDQQDPSGGWGEQPGKKPNTLNTAEVIIAILDVDGDVAQPGSAPIQHGVDFLLKHQLSGAMDSGAWPRGVPLDDGTLVKTPDIIRTSLAIQALIKAGRGVTETSIRNAVDWLLRIRRIDKGWSHRGDATTTIMPTCFALMALVEACKAGSSACKEAIQEGLEFLATEYQRNDGSFGEPGPLTAAHTIYATLVLQKARRYGLPSYSQQERRAIDWLLVNPDEAKKLVEERVLLDATNSRENYSYLYMTGSLLIRVLNGCDDSEDWRALCPGTRSLALKTTWTPRGAFTATACSPGLRRWPYWRWGLPPSNTRSFRDGLPSTGA